MNYRPVKYIFPFIVFAGAWVAFQSTGWLTFLPVIFSFGFIPLLELLIQPNSKNLSAAEEELIKADKTYDYLLYSVVPVHYFLLITYLFSLQQTGLNWIDITGRTVSMGLLCGIFGINTAHELGHRANKFEQFLAKALLLSTQYMHFFIEHNKGHHKRVATHDDPATARYKELIFSFYVRSILFSYISAWEIANKEVKRKGHSAFSLKNEMLQYQLIQLLFTAVIFLVFTWQIGLLYLAASFIGILLLEAVNYIEHYGLSRKQIADGKFERAMPHHSWNSNHVIGRTLLFELSRHSDHHYLASRKYQVLRHHDDSPQMPTGYPGMLILAHIPPLWFYVMHKKINMYSAAA
jgi:alkane 1-monooxygenase